MVLNKQSFENGIYDLVKKGDPHIKVFLFDFEEINIFV